MLCSDTDKTFDHGIVTGCMDDRGHLDCFRPRAEYAHHFIHCYLSFGNSDDAYPYTKEYAWKKHRDS